MSEKQMQMAADILGVFVRLPENKQHRLLGVAEGMEMASNMSEAPKPDGSPRKNVRDGA